MDQVLNIKNFDNVHKERQNKNTYLVFRFLVTKINVKEVPQFVRV